MTPGEYSAGGNTLLIEHPLGGVRVAPHVFDLPDGIAWVDAGFTDPLQSSHTAHVAPGNFELFDLGWAAKSPDGDIFIEEMSGTPQEGTRAQAKEAIEQSLGVSIPG